MRELLKRAKDLLLFAKLCRVGHHASVDWHAERRLWFSDLAAFEARKMKVKPYAIGQGTTSWDWTAMLWDNIDINRGESFASRDEALADARRVAGELGLELELSE